MAALIFSILIFGSSALANQCASLFSEQSILINGNIFSNSSINQLIRDFKEPVVKIELLNSRYNILYIGTSAKEQYDGTASLLIDLYEKGMIGVIRSMGLQLKAELLNAKNSSEVAEIYKKYFIKENGLEELNNDSLIYLTAEKTMKKNNIIGIKSTLNADGHIKDLQIGPIKNGIYFLRLHSKKRVKETGFMYRK